MEYNKCTKASFVVIGKEGATMDGEGFIPKLWEDTFPQVIKYLEENQLPLVGAVHDFTCPETGKNYMFFPIRRL